MFTRTQRVCRRRDRHATAADPGAERRLQVLEVADGQHAAARHPAQARDGVRVADDGDDLDPDGEPRSMPRGAPAARRGRAADEEGDRDARRLSSATTRATSMMAKRGLGVLDDREIVEQAARVSVRQRPDGEDLALGELGGGLADDDRDGRGRRGSRARRASRRRSPRARTPRRSRSRRSRGSARSRGDCGGSPRTGAPCRCRSWPSTSSGCCAARRRAGTRAGRGTRCRSSVRSRVGLPSRSRTKPVLMLGMPIVRGCTNSSAASVQTSSRRTRPSGSARTVRTGPTGTTPRRAVGIVKSSVWAARLPQTRHGELGEPVADRHLEP